MSAWLWAAVCDDVAGAEAWVELGAGGVASLDAELLHAPIVATAANAASPVATVLTLFTTDPFVVLVGSVQHFPREYGSSSRSVNFR
jgi:hypothetical protein